MDKTDNVKKSTLVGPGRILLVEIQTLATISSIKTSLKSIEREIPPSRQILVEI
jgi:hypothetical protein